jgi:hypothetical protein
MPKSRWVLFAAAASVTACVASPPPPPAFALRDGEVPVATRWQQFCEQSTSVSQASWLAASRGNQGWELVGMHGGVLCYKRPVPADPLPALAPPPPAVMAGAAPRAAPARSNSVVPSVIEPGF